MSKETRYFKNYGEIQKLPVKTRDDFFVKYYAADISRKAYAYLRITQGKSVGGMVTREDLLAAREKATELVNGEKLLLAESGYKRTIKLFFKSLHIDENLFKIDGKYVMSDSLMRLFSYILDEKGGVTYCVTHRLYGEIAVREYDYIASLVITAIKNTTFYIDDCENENQRQYVLEARKKQSAINEKAVEQFLLAYNEELKKWKVPATPQISSNMVVDSILEAAWEAIGETEWTFKKGEFQNWRNDANWGKVVELVYDKLSRQNIPLPNEEEYRNKLFNFDDLDDLIERMKR